MTHQALLCAATFNPHNGAQKKSKLLCEYSPRQQPSHHKGLSKSSEMVSRTLASDQNRSSQVVQGGDHCRVLRQSPDLLGTCSPGNFSRVHVSIESRLALARRSDQVGSQRKLKNRVVSSPSLSPGPSPRFQRRFQKRGTEELKKHEETGVGLEGVRSVCGSDSWARICRWGVAEVQNKSFSVPKAPSRFRILAFLGSKLMDPVGFCGMGFWVAGGSKRRNSTLSIPPSLPLSLCLSSSLSISLSLSASLYLYLSLSPSLWLKTDAGELGEWKRRKGTGH